MIAQASVAQIRRGEISPSDGYVVIAMCFFPRGLKRELRNESRSNLAPDRALFKEWQKFEQEFGHDLAFAKSNYEQRFQLDDSAKYDLRRLTELSRTKNVYLVCQCAVGERCHREMVMLFAQRFYQATIAPVFHSYPDFMARWPAQDSH